MILFGERSLRRALSDYVDHFHAERNHQGKGNFLLFPRNTDVTSRGLCSAAKDWAGFCATIIVRRRDGASVGSVFWPYAHKIDGVSEAIAAVGATVRCLPAYSPDLNPIEIAFSKLKAALRKGAKRTVKHLCRLIGKLVKSFAPKRCATYFRHAGYRR